MSERTDLQGRHILLGLSGGIACYKAAELCRALVKEGATVQVVMTEAAGQFITPDWCQDEAGMAVETVSTPDVPLQLQGCAAGGSTGAIGTFQMNTNLIKTDGGQTDAVILTNVLGNDSARFAVFPHGKHKDLLSVGLFINLPMLNAAKDKLMAMPVFKRGGYDGNVNLSFTVDIINDTDKPAKFYLTDVDAGGDLPADEAILTIPPAGMDTVTLDAQTQGILGSRGWVNFMSLILK